MLYRNLATEAIRKHSYTTLMSCRRHLSLAGANDCTAPCGMTAWEKMFTDHGRMIACRKKLAIRQGNSLGENLGRDTAGLSVIVRPGQVFQAFALLSKRKPNKVFETLLGL